MTAPPASEPEQRTERRRGHGVEWKGGPRGAAVLLLLCLGVYLPGLATIPVVDRDEARFAQASRQMFEAVAWSGDAERFDPALHDGGWLIPKVGDRWRLNKPPLIYWLQAGSAAVSTGGDPERDAIWMYRVPSVACAILTALFTWRLGCAMWDARVGLLAGALMAVCPMVIWDANQARADQLLLVCTTGALVLLWRLADPKGRGGWGSAVLLGAAIGLGTLAKGLTPLFVVMGALAWSMAARRWSWRGLALGGIASVVALAVVAPWVVGVIAETGWDTYSAIVFDETIDRSRAPKEGHWGPPGYHLVLLPVLFWPGSLLTAAAVVWAARRAFRRGAGGPDGGSGGRVSRAIAGIRGRRLGRAPELFCLCWIVPAWILFELVSTKLPHYTLPLYPAIALLTARGLLAADAGSLPGASGRGALLGRVIWGVLGFGIASATVAGTMALLPPDATGSDRATALLPVIAGCVCALVLLVFAIMRLSRDRFISATRVSIGAVVIALGAFLHAGMPQASGLGGRIQEAVALLDPDGGGAIGACGYVEDSLLFHSRGRAVRLSYGDLGAWISEHPDGVLVLDAETATRAVGDGLIASDSSGIVLEGMNLGGGRFVGVHVIGAPVGGSSDGPPR